MREPTNNHRQDKNWRTEARTLGKADMEVMHLPRRLWPVSFKEVRSNTRLHEVVVKLRNTFAGGKLADMPTLIKMHGPPDTGKTEAAAIIAKFARAHKATGLWAEVGTLQRRLVTSEVTADEELTWAERCLVTEVLVLDGLGREGASVFIKSELAAIIQHRQDNLMLTIVTTNLSAKELNEIYGSGVTAALRRNSVPVKCIEMPKEDTEP